MFPRLREQIGTALDLLVEFSTLGEYRLAVDAAGAASAPVEAPSQAPQLGGVGARAPRAAVRRNVAGGAAGNSPVATPAARRLTPPSTAAARRLRDQRGPRTRVPAPRSRARGGAARAPEQLCLAV